MIILPPPPSQRRKPDHQQVQQAAASAGLALPDVALLAFQQGRVLEAIKLIRTANPGLDLSRAKAAFERMQAHAGAADANSGFAGIGKAPPPAARQKRPPTVAMGDPPGQLRWLLVMVALLVAAAWIGFNGVA
jgi:hypothetical protein